MQEPLLSCLESEKTYIAFYESIDSFIHDTYDAIFYEIDFKQIMTESWKRKTKYFGKSDVYVSKKKEYRFFLPIMMKEFLDLRRHPFSQSTIEPFLFRFFQGQKLFQFSNSHYKNLPSLDVTRHDQWNTIESRSVSTYYQNGNRTDFILQDLIFFTEFVHQKRIKMLYIPQSLGSLCEIVSKGNKSFEASTLYYYLHATFILFQESLVQTVLKKVDILCLPSSHMRCQLRVIDRNGGEMARYGFDFTDDYKIFQAEKVERHIEMIEECSRPVREPKESPISPLRKLQCYNVAFKRDTNVKTPSRLYIRSHLMTTENFAKFYIDDEEVSTHYNFNECDELTLSVLQIFTADPIRFEILSSLHSVVQVDNTKEIFEFSSLYMSRKKDFIQSLVGYVQTCSEKISAREKVKIMYLFGMYLVYNYIKR